MLQIISLIVIPWIVMSCGDMNVSDPQLDAKAEEAPENGDDKSISQGDGSVAVQSEVDVQVTVNNDVFMYDANDPYFIVKPEATWAGHMGSAGAYRLATRAELMELIDAGELEDIPSWVHFWTATEDDVHPDSMAIVVRSDDGYNYGVLKITKFQAVFVRAQ